jgi:hypothetical protein
VCALASSLLSVTVSRGLIKIKEAVSAIEFRGVFLIVSIPPMFSERKESHQRAGYNSYLHFDSKTVNPTLLQWALQVLTYTNADLNTLIKVV